MQNPYLSLPAAARDSVGNRMPQRLQRTAVAAYGAAPVQTRWTAEAAANCGPSGEPDDCEGVMGFLDAAVATATQSTITEVAQSCGLCDRLVVTDAFENTFQIDDVLIGRASVFPTTPMSGCSYKSDQTMRCMRTAGVFTNGKNVSLVVTNFTGGAARCSANIHYRVLDNPIG